MRGTSSLVWILAVVSMSACYRGARASHGINESWRGRSANELQATWGKATSNSQKAGGTTLRFTHTHHHIEELPSLRAELQLGPNGLDAYGEIRAGVTSKSTTTVTAQVDSRGIVQQVSGPSLRWGPSGDANLRWGLLLGMHAGMGRLDDTGTALPSGGLYIGGMLGPRLGLVGSYSLAAGSDDAGGALGMAWSLGAQWWPQTRLSLRAGPAMILAFDPGFDNVGLEGGVNGSVSYALVRAGSFVFDVRADLTAGTNTKFGSLGVGVNLN